MRAASCRLARAFVCFLRWCLCSPDLVQNGKVTAALVGTLVRALGKNPLQKEVDQWISDLGGADTPIDVATVKKVTAKPVDCRVALGFRVVSLPRR